MINKKKHFKNLLLNKRDNCINNLFKQNKFIGKNVLYPTYTFDKRLQIHREAAPPPKEVFLPVGYDPKHDSKQKHYRRFYPDELENVREVIPRSPFESFEVKRGQSRGLSKGWFFANKVDSDGNLSSEKTVGKFKGIVTVINKQREESFNLVKETRIQILKGSLDDLSKAVFNEKLDFDYDTLSTAEGKEVF